MHPRPPYRTPRKDLIVPTPPNCPDLKLLSSLVVRKALDGAVLEVFEQTSGISVQRVYVPTTVLVRMLEAGAEADVLIGTREALRRLDDSGLLASGSILPLVRSSIGLGVAPGAEPPAAATEDDVIETLLNARSVAFSRAGQSGIFFQELLRRLGIAEPVLTRATALESGFTGTALMDGRADLAVQQISELLFVDGIDTAVPLPDELQQHTEFSIAVGSASADRRAAHRLVHHLMSGEATAAYSATGLEIVSR